MLASSCLSMGYSGSFSALPTIFATDAAIYSQPSLSTKDTKNSVHKITNAFWAAFTFHKLTIFKSCFWDRKTSLKQWVIANNSSQPIEINEQKLRSMYFNGSALTRTSFGSAQYIYKEWNNLSTFPSMEMNCSASSSKWAHSCSEQK